MIDWTAEWPLILAESAIYGVDPYFISAIRVAENGGDGRQFGVLSVPAPTYADQLREACITVRNHKALCANASLYGRRAYTADQVAEFAKSWAPTDAENDPGGLNAHWFKDCWSAYSGFCQNQKVGLGERSE